MCSSSSDLRARTHRYIPGNDSVGDILGWNKSTDGSRKLVVTMKYVFGKYVDFYPIHKNFLARTDDTTLFISPGKIVHI